MFISLLLWACNAEPVNEKLSVDLRPRVIERVAEPISGHFQRRFPSTVSAVQDSWLSSETGGKVDQIPVEIGHRIGKTGRNALTTEF